jgi:hypothetical protein
VPSRQIVSITIAFWGHDGRSAFIDDERTVARALADLVLGHRGRKVRFCFTGR